MRLASRGVACPARLGGVLGGYTSNDKCGNRNTNSTTSKDYAKIKTRSTLRIAFFTDTYLPTPTGTAVVVETYRRHLAKLGHDVFVIAPQFAKYKDSSKNIIRVPSVQLPNRPETPLARPITGRVLRTIKKLDLDIIHTFSIYSVGNFGLEFAKKTRRPAIFTMDALYTEHIKYYRDIFKPFARSWYIRQSRRHANQSTCVLVPTPSARRLVTKLGVVSPVHIVPAGVDVSDFSSTTPQALRDHFNIPAGQKILLFVGRLDEQSNIRFLLRTFREVWYKDEHVHLLLIGRGPQEDIFQKIVEREPFGDNVTFGGFMPKGELNKVYGACDLFLFPCTNATQAIVILEAMASGLPTVAINRLAPSDIVHDNEDGFLTPLNENAFSDRIIYLLRNPKIRLHFGRVARARAKAFSTQNSVLRLLNIYQKTLKHNG
ncbi:MAG: glycosyltransferase [Patescibacteria group bacterium]